MTLARKLEAYANRTNSKTGLSFARNLAQLTGFLRELWGLGFKFRI